MSDRLRNLIDRWRQPPPPDSSLQPVLLIVGLGNPGSDYAGNRHNVGFWCLNRLARRHGITFKHSRTASVGEGTIAGQPVILVKPRTFVNRSGDAVAPLLRKYKLQPQQILAVYDELDLPVGVVRLRPKGSHGGHNGMKSIIAAVGSDDFPRIRIGIGRPLINGKPSWDPDVIAGYVLSDPPPDERKLLEEAAERAADAIEAFLREGLDRAMNRFNR